MIKDVLFFFKKTLDEYLQVNSAGIPDGMHEDRVVFVDGENQDPISFKKEAVTLLLVNIEEENVLRSADPYSKTRMDGSILKGQPEIRLNLYILFVARFKQYEKSLDHISMIIRYFQKNRLLNQQNTPALGDRIKKLSVELITLPFGEQNEIWSSLRTGYQPSLLYKVKMLIFTDEDAMSGVEIGSKDISIQELQK